MRILRVSGGVGTGVGVGEQAGVYSLTLDDLICEQFSFLILSRFLNSVCDVYIHNT